MFVVYPFHVDLCRLLPANYVCSLLCQDIWPQTTNWNWIIHYVVFVCCQRCVCVTLLACSIRICMRVCVLQVDFAFYLFIHFNWIYAVCANAPRAKCCAMMRSCCYFVSLANLHILAWNKCANICHAPFPASPLPRPPQRPLLQQLRSLRCLPLALCKFNRAIFMTLDKGKSAEGKEREREYVK